MNRVLLTLRECYEEPREYYSAGWRVMALGEVINDPRLAPWILAKGPERWELHDAIIAVAATAPSMPMGTS